MEILMRTLLWAAAIALVLFIFEYRIKQPNVLVLYETKESFKLRTGFIYPRHFSLVIDRAAQPIQLTTEVLASGNLLLNISLVGLAAPSLQNLNALILAGGWTSGAVANAAEESKVMLQNIIQEYTGQHEIESLTSSGILDHLNQQSELITEQLGIELVSLGIASLEPSDPEISNALQQQEQARLFEKTEILNQQARSAAAKAKHQTDEEITAMEYAHNMKKADLDMDLINKEAELAKNRLEHELSRNRQRLAFETEEVNLLKNSPELLMLTPQAARLAEASQTLKNAKTVVSVSPQDFAQGSELFELFQTLLQKALDSKENQNLEDNS